jgi:hypothetical protein
MFLLANKDLPEGRFEFDATDLFFVEVHVSDFFIVVADLFNKFHSVGEHLLELGVVFRDFFLFHVLTELASKDDFLHHCDIVNALE